MDKYISIITNFGCHYKCPYCIVKNNNLQIPKTTIKGLDNLEKEIISNRCNWVSLSGGGDPLWNIDEHKDWYRKFFEITDKNKVCTELHTSMINVETEFNEKFDRIVYHLHDFEQLKSIKKHYDSQIVRVVFVVTDKFTKELIDKIAEYCDKSNIIDELSFRQMVDGNYNETYYCADYLKEGHKKLWWYIEQKDYNLYYCENKLYTQYSKIGKGE